MKNLACAIQFRPDGTGVCLNTDTIPLQEIGSLEATRASNVEFNGARQKWEVRFTDQPDRVVFSHPSRAECIKWEIETLNRKVLKLKL